jgi:hypothetical protein
VYDTINKAEGGPAAVMGQMVRHIGYSPIGDMIVKLYVQIITSVVRLVRWVCVLTWSIPGYYCGAIQGRSYHRHPDVAPVLGVREIVRVDRLQESVCSVLSLTFTFWMRSKWKFYEHLAEWRLLVKLAQAISCSESVCFLPEKSASSEDDVIVADTHAAAAAMVFQDLLEKLTSDDSAEILLQPVGHCPELIDELVGCGTNAELSNERRRYALQVLNFLLKRTADEQIVIFSGGLGMAMAPKFLANRLYPLRQPFIAHLSKKFGDLCKALLAYGQVSRQTQESESIRHPGGYASLPFSSSRLALVELIVLLVEATPRLATLISVDLWRELLQWCFRYPHNNIYHSLYYRLLFQVLRYVLTPAMSCDGHVLGNDV